MNWVLIILSFIVSAFIFMFFFNFRNIKTKSIIGRISDYAENFSYINNRVNKRQSGIKLFLKERGPVRVLRVRISSSTDIFVFRIILSITAVILFSIPGLFIGKRFFILAFILAIILYFLPIEILKGRIKLISTKICNELPDFLDILSSLIKTGLNTDRAINYYANNYKGEISNLFRIAQTKILEGNSPKEAYFKISELSFCDEFCAIIKVIIQSDLVGNPINIVLKNLSGAIRRDQRGHIKVRAERLEGSLMLVIFTFMFIPMMVLFLLPVIPQIRMIFN